MHLQNGEGTLMSEGIMGMNTFCYCINLSLLQMFHGINNGYGDGFCSWKFKHRKGTDMFNVKILEGNTFPDL